MNTEYYKGKDFYYTEKATLLEELKFRTSGSGIIGKFYIGAITPLIRGDTVITKNNVRGSISNILGDKSKLAIENCTITNYVELRIPNHLISDIATTIIENEIDYYYIPKGVNVIIVFVGGDINKPKIIGGYD